MAVNSKSLELVCSLCCCKSLNLISKSLNLFVPYIVTYNKCFAHLELREGVGVLAHAKGVPAGVQRVVRAAAAAGEQDAAAAEATD
jgi:hypothetical protein